MLSDGKIKFIKTILRIFGVAKLGDVGKLWRMELEVKTKNTDGGGLEWKNN